MRVLILVDNNLKIDGRTRKQALSLAQAGYDVHVIGIGTEIPQEVAAEPYTMHLSESRIEGKPLLHPLGREEIFKPLRVLVNKTITASRIKAFNKKYNEGMKLSEHSRRPDMISVGLDIAPDIVQAQDLDTLYAASELAKGFNAALIYDSHELFLDLHFLEEEHRADYARIEAEIFPTLDGFITVAPRIADILVKKYESDIEPVIIYNGAAKMAESVTPIYSPVKILFQGAFVPDRNNLELIEAMQQLRGKASLTFQGWGADEEPMRSLIAELELEDVVSIIPPCSPLEVVDSANYYDIGIMNYKLLDESLVNALPNKLFDYMAAGLAIASTSAPLIKEIVDEEECGITYEQRGVMHTASVLLDLVSDRKRLATFKRNALKAAEKYSWAEQEKKYLALYEQVENKLAHRRG